DWFAKALNRAFEIKLVTKDDFHHKADHYLLKKLKKSKDPVVKKYLSYCETNEETFKVVWDDSPYDIKWKAKFRGVNPLYLTEKGLLKRVTDADVGFAARFHALKNKLQNGLKIKRLKS
ncbi:MAG: hypothetical protein AAF963_01610, partial [Bacteroidota bacterium]